MDFSSVDFQQVWPGLPPEICQKIKEVGQFKDIAKGDMLFQTGQMPKGFYIVQSGLFAVTCMTCEGDEQILGLYSHRHFLGHRAFWAQDSYLASAVALEKGRVLFLETNVFNNLVKEFPNIMESFCKYFSMELRTADKRIMDLTHKRVEKRIAQAVLYLKTRYPDYAWTRREIAEFCGTTTATVIRTLGKFEKIGLVNQNRRELNLSNLEQFKELALKDSCEE
jgi:CRP-like cAMP-binding protein